MRNWRQTVIGRIPEEWTLTSLPELGELAPGVNKPIAKMGRGCLYVTVKDLYAGTSIDVGGLGRCEMTAAEIARFGLTPGDIVFGKSSVKREGIGYPSVFRGAPEAAVPSGFTYRARIRPDENDPLFVFYQLRSEAVRSWVIANSQASALTNLNASIANRIPIALPPSAREQHRIAQALSNADGLIAALERLIAKKQAIKQGMMQQLLTGKTRLPGFTEPWTEVRLGELAQFSKGMGLPKSSVVDGGRLPCIHYGELFTQYGAEIGVVRGRTNDARLRVRSFKCDVLMPTSDVTPRGLAKASSVLADGVILGGDILVIRPDASRLLGPFLAHLIRHGADQVLQLVRGSTVFHIYAADMKGFNIRVPAFAEQQAVCDALRDVESEIDGVRIRLIKARQIKQGMMQELLSGRTRLPVGEVVA